MSTQVAAFWRNNRTLLIRLLVILAALFLLFEVGVRLLTPDAVRYDVQLSTNGGSAIALTGTITDPTTISRWRAAVTQRSSGHSLIGTLLSESQKQNNCALSSNIAVSYDFLWHGLVIEAVSSLPVCPQEYMISSGGLPDPGTYLFPQLVPF